MGGSGVLESHEAPGRHSRINNSKKRSSTPRERILQNTDPERKHSNAESRHASVKRAPPPLYARDKSGETQTDGSPSMHKPGKHRDLPASYRLISLLSGVGKLFDRTLKTRLSDHLLGQGLIIDEQFGFRQVN
ncbi:Probable RNA-directed DNA polymerase from transposon X-element [Eumeta japonica]|uniref:Probable RNA-directed DNA polymerase from transposon X-element n=1 Tax=Eumeta variegata TaxID=151549 RepID=A0A4C1TLR5_EUMVA|nr:Probable RNA-directed DNA polymerase from transposon X-element [Eumeta japonica]